MAGIRARFAAAMAVALVVAALGGCWSYTSDAAKQRFVARTGPFTVTVYPVHVMRGPQVVHDAAIAQELARFLEAEGLARPVVAAAPIEYAFEGGFNQARMAKHSARAFAAQVKAAAIATDYALMVEVLANPDETAVGGVHYYLVERGGEIADGSLTNSHWEEFERVRPHDRRGALEVAKLMLRANWGKAPARTGGSGG